MSQIKLDTDLLRFMTAGNAYFTLKNETNQERVTYRVVDAHRAIKGDNSPEAGKLFFVSFLIGQNNMSGYAFIGSISKDHAGHFNFKHSVKAKAKIDSKQVKGIDWLLKTVQKGALPTQMQFYHEGRCARCGRLLTVPESIQSGYGPECIQKVGS